MKQNFKNITHLIMGPILSVDADIVGVQALKCDMKVKPNDGEGNILHFIICSLHKHELNSYACIPTVTNIFNFQYSNKSSQFSYSLSSGVINNDVI